MHSARAHFRRPSQGQDPGGTGRYTASTRTGRTGQVARLGPERRSLAQAHTWCSPLFSSPSPGRTAPFSRRACARRPAPGPRHGLFITVGRCVAEAWCAGAPKRASAHLGRRARLRYNPVSSKLSRSEAQRHAGSSARTRGARPERAVQYLRRVRNVPARALRPTGATS